MSRGLDHHVSLEVHVVWAHFIWFGPVGTRGLHVRLGGVGGYFYWFSDIPGVA